MRWRRALMIAAMMARQARMPTIQAPGGADRAFRAAAHQAEIDVHRRNRLAARHEPGGAAPDEQAAERDDEGGHAEKGDDDAMQRADQRADDQPAGQRDDPDGRVIEAEHLRQKPCLQHTHDHAGEAEDRADRKVDVAGDDDEHHAGRHDGDRGGLHRKVPQVARRQEKAACQDMEPEPDDQQGADHAEHAGVDLGGAEEAGNDIAFRLSCRSRCLGIRCGLYCLGHDSPFPTLARRFGSKMSSRITPARRSAAE